MADRSQFWQNVDATKPDKLSRLSVRQLHDYQNYFLEVQGDYNPALAPHENTVASERLTLLRDEIGSRRGKRQPGATVAERRHKQVVFWMKITAIVAVVGVLVAILTLCRPSSPPFAPPVKLNPATAEPSPAPTTAATQSIPLTITTPSPFVTPVSFSPVTLAEIDRVASDSKLTDLQKDEFRRKHDGKIVEWTMRVLSVKPLRDTHPDSDFSVTFASPDMKDSPRLGKIGVAIFPANLRDDMLDLHSGDLIRFRGVLKLSAQSLRFVSVDNCQLLEHQAK